MIRLSLRRFAILAFALMVPLSAQRITTLAVLEFDGRGIADHEAASLTDWLRSEIVRVGNVPLVERGDMLGIILAEQDLQLLDCTSDECAIQIGQLLGVTHIVAGSMGKVGSTYTILARVIDVGTSRVIKTPSRRYQGSIDGLFDEMTPIAYEIVDRKFVPVRKQTAPATRPPVIKTTPQETVRPLQKPATSEGSPFLYMIGGLIFMYGVVTGSLGIAGLGVIIGVVGIG